MEEALNLIKKKQKQKQQLHKIKMGNVIKGYGLEVAYSQMIVQNHYKSRQFMPKNITYVKKTTKKQNNL